MAITLYNTLTRSIDAFEPMVEGQVGVYACGLTVYDYTHLGHLRKYTMDDILVKMLRMSGLTVRHVQNITDVGHLVSDADSGEDKLEKGAKKYGKTAWEVAREFEEFFWKSMDAMGAQRPTVSCRATEHIAQQLAMVKVLEKKGMTYEIPNDGIYFDTSMFPNYGKLARLKIEDQQEGLRLEKNQYKRHHTDFALWKFEREGEKRAMVWKSPWHERSFPGWHIECSAMAMHYLGEQFDIHTGGIDHIPVHHTNEIAQAEASTGKDPFVRFWVHHNFLRVDGEKMSKSLGNFFTIHDVISRGFNPMALRLLFLTTHYRGELNFTWDSLQAVQKKYDTLLSQITECLKKMTPQEIEKITAQNRLHSKSSEKMDTSKNEYTSEWWHHLEKDLATPEAITVLWKVMKDKQLSPSELVSTVSMMDSVFGLRIIESAQLLFTQARAESTKALPKEVAVLLEDRKAARNEKQWQRADEIRDALFALGYEIEDLPNGEQKLSVKNDS